MVSAPAAIYAVMAMRDRPDSSTLLYRIGCPTMVVTGDEDTMIRVEDSRAMADVIPGRAVIGMTAPRRQAAHTRPAGALAPLTCCPRRTFSLLAGHDPDAHRRRHHRLLTARL